METLLWYLTQVKEWGNDPNPVIASFFDKAENDTLNAFARLEKVPKEVDPNSLLAWAPIAIKDNFLLASTISSNWSTMLSEYNSPYTSTVVQKLLDAWASLVWKTNMDDSAMWSSTETCVFGPVLNPADITKVPWWSSWGSAVAVAAWLCLGSIWSDTAGSVRQPAALCGIVWVKPTYGRASRYGLISMASSLDQPGVFASNVRDAEYLLSIISWYDPLDANMADRDEDIPWWRKKIWTSLEWIKLALPKEFIVDWLDPLIKERLDMTISSLREKWAIIDEVSIPTLQYWVPIYYIISPAEVSTNLARYDWLRFGTQDKMSKYDSLPTYSWSMRSAWFGKEILRRIMLWTYVLSAWYYDAYYIKAQNVRRLLTKQVSEVLDSYDGVIWPTSPTTAWKLWEKIDDPVSMYLSDIYTVVANLVWLPSISVPMWNVETDWVPMPCGFQIMTTHRDEATMFQIAQWVEDIRNITSSL